MRKISIVAGIGYLIIFVTGIFANFIVIEGLVVPEDVDKTVANVSGSLGLFRLGIFSFLLMVIFDLVLTWALYLLLKPVNKDISLLTAWFRLVNVALFGVAVFHLFAVLQLINGVGPMGVFEHSQLNAQVMLSFISFNDIWLIGLIFFGIHLFFLGYLIIRSGYIPKILGVLLIIAGIGYLVDSFASFLFPRYSDFETVFMLLVVIPGVIGELSFTIWLLLRGGKKPIPNH